MEWEKKDYFNTPLYISDMQSYINNLHHDEKSKVVLYLKLSADDKCRWVEFYMPSDRIIAQNLSFYEKYFLAMLNNMIVMYGGERLEIYFDFNSGILYNIVKASIKKFQIDSPINNRTGYGIYINYINRMNKYLNLNAFSGHMSDISLWICPPDNMVAKFSSDMSCDESRAKLRHAATNMNGKIFCSLDIGGNSIKGAVIKDEEILILQELCWYPTGCKTANEILEPIVTMLKFFQKYTSNPSYCKENICHKLSRKVTTADLTQIINELELLGNTSLLFDAIVIGFPDIVVANKISGGETFKQIGMKAHAKDNYDSEFAKTSNLDLYAAKFVKPNGKTIVLNDGNAASFITSVEFAFTEKGLPCDSGMFVNTIGTEMGTGFVSTEGTIQRFPLELYQSIIDLGNTKYAEYDPIDLRSTLSLSTTVHGTVQKSITQLGLFRMVVNALIEANSSICRKWLKDGILVNDTANNLLYVQTTPTDKRSILTKEIITLLNNHHPIVCDCVKKMGKAMGVLIDQGAIFAPEISYVRIVSGGIIACDNLFEHMVMGLKEHNANYSLIRLDESTSHSPILRRMEPSQRNFNVAIGSSYIGNYALMYEPSRQ